MKTFDHPKFKAYGNRYKVSKEGKIFNSKAKELTYHKMPSGGKFVRLSDGYGSCVSITVAKVVLLTFDPKQYKDGKLALHCDGNVLNDERSNLKWGTRGMQTAISMKDKDHAARVGAMAKTHYKTDEKTEQIKKLENLTPVQIAKETGYKLMTVYIHLKKIAKEKKQIELNKRFTTKSLQLSK